MKRRLPIRVLSLLLALALLFAPAAQALTLEQARMLLTQYYIDDIPASVLDALSERAESRAAEAMA